MKEVVLATTTNNSCNGCTEYNCYNSRREVITFISCRNGTNHNIYTYIYKRLFKLCQLRPTHPLESNKLFGILSHKTRNELTNTKLMGNFRLKVKVQKIKQVQEKDSEKKSRKLIFVI